MSVARGRRAVAVALALLAPALLPACGAAEVAGDGGAPVQISDRSDTGGPYAGIEVEPAFPLPRARLTGDDGRAVELSADLDRPVRVFFYGYTLCPDVCPLVMANLALAVARLPDDVAARVQVVFVTSDPARDTPEALRAYLDRFDPDFTGYTGELATIVDVAQHMGVAVDRGRRLPSGGYEVTHGAELIGYDGDDGVVLWPQGTSVDDLASDLARLVAAAGTGTRQ